LRLAGFECLTEHLFGLAFGVDIGGIEEVDTAVEAGSDELFDAGLVDLADGFPNAGAAVEVMVPKQRVETRSPVPPRS
jgi:hypothetical protein